MSLLGGLSNVHQLITQLVQDLPENEVNQCFHPGLPSMGWLLGRSVYLETLWLREKLLDEDDLTTRVRHLFGQQYTEQADQALPPKDHLLNWALEIQEENLTKLANPASLPQHPWLENEWLSSYLLQVHSQIYEQMISVLAARSLSQPTIDFMVDDPMVAQLSLPETIEISQGHYRVGARNGVVFDNEQPMQMVELNNYRICTQPVSNSQYLSFIQADGYNKDQHWSDDGLAWKARSNQHCPWHWRKDNKGNWYAIGLNGGVELMGDDPLSGISLHEAEAFTRWVSSEQDDFKGAILPHEYQWEVAARTQGMSSYGRVWEWCSNIFDPYDQYEKPADPEMGTDAFDGQHFSRRGGCLHTQNTLRRSSYRQWGKAEDQHLFTGVRLVLPPAHELDDLYIEQWQKFLQ